MFIKALNAVLAKKRVGNLWVIAFQNTGGENSFAVARAAFAVIIKLSNLTGKLLEALTMLEIQEVSAFDDAEEGDPQAEKEAINEYA